MWRRMVVAGEKKPAEKRVVSSGLGYKIGGDEGFENCAVRVGKRTAVAEMRSLLICPEVEEKQSDAKIPYFGIQVIF